MSRKKRKKKALNYITDSVKPKTIENLVEVIQNEKVTLTDKIMYFKPTGGTEYKDYFIFWKIVNRRAVWEKGVIVLVDNEHTEDYFKQAFERKYETEIPNEEIYSETIKERIKKARHIYPYNNHKV